MIRKTLALPLRISPYSNTSHVVTWLTEEGDRLSSMVKGACRPRSAFLGQYDLFSTSELLYYPRDREGLSIARECALVEPRTRMREDWRAFAGASYANQLLLHSAMSGDPHPALYRLATLFFDYLNTHGAKPQAIYWFELQWLGILGFAPELRQCTRCRKSAEIPTTGMRWGRDGVVCPACANRSTIPGAPPLRTTALPPDALAILRRWQSQPDVHVLVTTQCSPRQVLVFERILGTFVRYHVETNSEARRIAIDMIGKSTVTSRR
jgi:DNA repair protein RecO